MKSNTKIAIAALLSAAGSLLNAFAVEFGNSASAGATEAATAPETPSPKKGKKASASTVETPPEPAAEPPVEEPATTGEGKTYEELRALIAQPVKDGQGEEVKKIIKKYAGEGGSLKTLDAKHHAAFEKDIQALTY